MSPGWQNGKKELKAGQLKWKTERISEWKHWERGCEPAWAGAALQPGRCEVQGGDEGQTSPGECREQREYREQRE